MNAQPGRWEEGKTNKPTFMGKRILILTGAGAAYPWFRDGIDASTKTITAEILKDPFCKIIYDELQSQFAPNFKDSINFETIINAIERVFQYYRGKQPPVNSDFPILFNPSDLITNHFEGKDPNEIPVIIYNVFRTSIEKISRLVEFYDALIKQSQNSVNVLLKDFLCDMKVKENLLRSYTTNYDQMFIDVTQKSILKLFDGFNYPTKDGSKEYILSEIDNSEMHDCFFNLHGCIYWHWKYIFPWDKGITQFELQQIPFNYSFSNDLRKDPLIETNPNEIHISSPIITGFNKLQRINQEPFNAFANAFYRDCHKADIFIFIGFSFNDSHINNVLNHVDWTGKKVLIVDKCEKPKNHKGVQNFENWCGESIVPDQFDAERNVNFYNKGFEKFLKGYSSVIEECGIKL